MDKDWVNEMSPRRHFTSSGSTNVQVNRYLTQLGKTVGYLQGHPDGFRRSRREDRIHHTRRQPTTIQLHIFNSRIQGFVGQLKKARKKKSSTSPARSSVMLRIRIQEPRCERQANLIGGSRQTIPTEAPKNANCFTTHLLDIKLL
ncbi:hypothetical protein GCK72_019531 [Caenorhabditis remanei]|uniref:Uncharacterized protein n=1 Tax=Caenorhabditis remanei TaxID=31234 RepID=A0A6A5GE32_CAERE|nr:hypothetical protein GCK72_019531 [Caenorhabditis remanei]KAF1752976.1 hypothetical protein GCK72_019531 [Caenorhabditis remanei]